MLRFVLPRSDLLLALFLRSDDEDGGKKSKKGKKSSGSGDGYAGSLLLKEGRSVNATLYYVDHSKLANNGNGLLPGACLLVLCAHILCH